MFGRPIGRAAADDEEWRLELEPHAPAQDYVYEPTPAAIFDELLPKHVEVQIWRALLESTAAEPAAIQAAFERLDAAAAGRPDAVVLLYVFNDIDYLRPATPRTGWGTLHPAGILFRNSYLFQEIYLRVRASGLVGNPRPPDPYFDAAVLARHIEV